MMVAVEISLYPLSDEFEKPIERFLLILESNTNISVEMGKMSSIITGDLSEIMKALEEGMGDVFRSNPAVFNLKISNCCPV